MSNEFYIDATAAVIFMGCLYTATYYFLIRNYDTMLSKEYQTREDED